MAYTVKKVAAMSGVSVRTLHFYDETSLLKPARHSANGYRLYEEPQLLMLQQILFYRELGFELKQIKQILGRPGFQKLKALQSHRKVLEQDLTRTARLLGTIEKTIQHLKGKKKMKTDDIFAGFTLGRGKDRFGEGVKLGDDPHDCKVSAQDTDGAMCAFEVTGRGSGPRHLHFDQDEWIYILEGEVEFAVGNKRFKAGAGESVFLPRKIPHAWACFSPSPARVLNVYQPAGKMESFFRNVSTYPDLPTKEQVLNKTYTEQQKLGMHKLFAEHGLDLLGPPLGFE